MLITCCESHAEKLRQSYWLVETAEEPWEGTCMLCVPPEPGPVMQYEATPRKLPRARRVTPGTQRKDTRARYREPFRSGW